MANENMKISQKGRDLIKEFEGLRLTAYQDSVGVWTIGYGHTHGVYAGMQITEHQANQFLDEDIKSHAYGIYNYVRVQLNQNQFDALVSFHFNLGAYILAGTDLLNYLNASRWNDAATEMKRYVYAGNEILLGLVRRREAEAKLFLEPINNLGNYYTTNPGYVRVLKDDYYYSSLVFDTGNRVGTLKTGVIVKIDRVDYTAEGIPRLKCGKGYISANKVFVVQQNMDQYITDNPKFVKVVKDDYYYSSLVFDTGNRVGTLKTGVIVKIDRVDFTAEGIPRLKCSKGYISANKVFVVHQNMDQYITENPKFVKVLKDDYYYSSLVFDTGNRVGTLKTGVIVKIDRVDYSAEGVPRLKCSKGYISANKVFVIQQNMDQYVTENPKFVKVLKDDYYYSSLAFDAGNRVGTLKTGVIVKIDRVDYSAEGVPRLKCGKGYISANKVFVVQQNMDQYITENPMFVKVIKDDYYYSSLAFDAGNRVGALKTGVIVKIDRVDYSAEGIPRLKCGKGYISANKVFVVQQNMDQYITENPGRVRVIKADYYYSSVVFDAGNRVGTLTVGELVNIDWIDYSAEGIPRLKCSRGYISANKVFVTNA